jgi:hypothetical protein
MKYINNDNYLPMCELFNKINKINKKEYLYKYGNYSDIDENVISLINNKKHKISTSLAACSKLSQNMMLIQIILHTLYSNNDKLLINHVMLHIITHDLLKNIVDTNITSYTMYSHIIDTNCDNDVIYNIINNGNLELNG